MFDQRLKDLKVSKATITPGLDAGGNLRIQLDGETLDGKKTWMGISLIPGFHAEIGVPYDTSE